MKVVLIIILLFVSVLLGVMWQDQAQQLNFTHFPVDAIAAKEPQEAFPLYVYFFFNWQDIGSLKGFFLELNGLPAHFKVFGVVPKDISLSQRRVRLATGATFPLVPENRYWRYKPPYTPALVGVSEKGKILFLRPLTPGTIKEVRPFLLIFYQQVSDALLKEKK